jgi:hypothetical protein
MDARKPGEPGEPPPEVLAKAPQDAVERRPPDEELPVVARLVVEIRSDGKRTIARGAVEDAASGERVAVEARGASPAQLAFALAKSLWSVPRLALRVRGLLGRGDKKR